MSKKVSIVISSFNRREDVLACLNSIKKITYPNYEIIVVDDASQDGSQEAIKRDFPEVKLVENNSNLGAALSRNRGVENSTGEFVFFLDSDTEVEPLVLSELLKGFKKYPEAGLVTPIIYYFEDKKKIWYAGAKISLITGKAKYREIDKIDSGQFKEIEIIKNGHAPTAFMVKKSIIEKIGGFNVSLFMGFEEPFLAKAIENRGYKIIFNPQAKVYHKIPTLKYRNKLTEFLFYISFRDPRIAYHTSKNRVAYMKAYSPRKNYFIFLFFFLPLSLLIYALKGILSWQPGMLSNIFLGTLAGLKIAVRTKKA